MTLLLRGTLAAVLVASTTTATAAAVALLTVGRGSGLRALLLLLRVRNRLHERLLRLLLRLLLWLTGSLLLLRLRRSLLLLLSASSSPAESASPPAHAAAPSSLLTLLLLLLLLFCLRSLRRSLVAVLSLSLAVAVATLRRARRPAGCARCLLRGGGCRGGCGCELTHVREGELHIAHKRSTSENEAGGRPLRRPSAALRGAQCVAHRACLLAAAVRALARSRRSVVVVLSMLCADLSECGERAEQHQREWRGSATLSWDPSRGA